FAVNIVNGKKRSHPNRRPRAGEKSNIFPHFFHTCGKKYVFPCFCKNKNAFISTFWNDIKAHCHKKMPTRGI
ncbi:hypothetical protein UIR13_04055, partial [Limosilactobacillus fermentum]